jgi:dTDP-4-amino-4,6-dideoxygalactose transaminase
MGSNEPRLSQSPAQHLDAAAQTAFSGFKHHGCDIRCPLGSSCCGGEDFASMSKIGMTDENYIPFNLPSIGQEEIEEVVSTLKSGWLTTGPKTAQFERELAAYVQAPHALAVNSATSALHLALAALGIGPGDEVITTPLTFCATVNTIFHVGATPVLADVGSDGNIDPKSIQERVTTRTRAIMPVHLAGLPCDMDAIWRIAKQKRLYVIEDAAHAIGSHYKGFPIGAGDTESGTHSDAVCFSFYATKNLATGEGGMVVTHNEQLYDKMKLLCLHGISKDAWNRYSERGNWFYDVADCGFKYNLSDIQSAIGIHQLRKLEGFTARRASIALRYNEAFAGIPELELPPDTGSSRHAWHLYALRLNLGRLNIDRDEFIRQLRAKNIGTSVHFIPVPLHTYFAAFASLPTNQCPHAMQLYPRLISLPLYPAMTDDQVERVIRAVSDIVASTRTEISLATGSTAQQPV